ncbi:MAG: BrnA antitoxin family protein [Elusimicrobiota bacterium]
MKAIQKFTPEYLTQCRKLTPEQIVKWLDDVRILHVRNVPAKSRPISIRIPENVLSSFRSKAELLGVPYQTQVNRLMREWVKGES